MKEIRSALVSVFNKDGLEDIADLLHSNNVTIYSTGGTAAFFKARNIPVVEVETITEYPSILGGRVKTLHPKVFGGILNRSENENDQKELASFQIPDIDCVVVDLYPFEDTVNSGGTSQEIIEKIDIGGISLIRAAAKNHSDVVIIPSKDQYTDLTQILRSGNKTDLETRTRLATLAFGVTKHYDSAISEYFETGSLSDDETTLRYGENPHQNGSFVGSMTDFIEQLHGKALSYNNLLDIDASLRLIRDFQDDAPTFAVVKHNNACGFATRGDSKTAYLDALAGDPVSAFGGIITTNKSIDEATAEEINKLFCEVVIAPEYSEGALEILKSKKNRIILIDHLHSFPTQIDRSILNGTLRQDADQKTVVESDLQTATKKQPSTEEINDLLFANKLAKHTKSNTIVLAKNNQLLASGVGQTSRVDALRQAINKAQSFNFDLEGAVMASDAFFPFPDCVEIASEVGVKSVIQPGGSIKDQDSIDFCDNNDISMVMTGHRHFKH
ncbi:MAG: bifunctional phosphoribosylaminoimidazolecarboxamide formyltransferase/IMP cyclohydrolase [Flavobacteriales bacterium]|jgi:phosphoribosylaminoimidazolecarboxamide formyltransferase / IMP cyclohydrolase|nr:bifunctional phosphoribosylaminoimidazolecarboxamide formyltransferase/IMP cyclohydrolase [Flavobacteriales bacterium]NCG29181.1 bifunctional phosphoribosylaminoimidazolecarboxamide formyltransferase/IMP cyclohydrolase [Bacteroidota bacterium]MBT3963281.1 bifunctional phosphoribosylaminoimidazolecarboxamide formyltransferase/IMP cyclohydrolase [Flavobacteriales bacterium]MBT4705896.1 bifunctional phosphoribosylaminoimidazolecarboxamide formyltransferase/IMP cyclohydrolase [Flavobacteriales ba